MPAEKPIAQDRRRAALRAYWMLAGSIGLALLMGALLLLRLESRAAYGLALASSFEEKVDSGDVELAMEAWAEDWLVLFVVTEGVDPAKYTALHEQMVQHLGRLDALTTNKNQVKGDRIEEMRQQTLDGVAALIGEDAAEAFVQDMKERWGDWTAQRRAAVLEEGAQRAAGSRGQGGRGAKGGRGRQ